MKRRLTGDKELQLFTKRFYPAGTYNWVVPLGCTEIEVFLVGGGAGGGNGYAGSGGSGSGYTKTYKKSNTSSGSYNSWVKDGEAIKVTPGQQINIVVGSGGEGGASTSGRNPVYGEDGNPTTLTVGDATYVAEGGKAYKGETASDGNMKCADGGTGSSRSGGWGNAAAASYSDGQQPPRDGTPYPGISQGHTTRDFGEQEFEPNAGGTSGNHGSGGKAAPQRSTGHTEGSGEDGTSWSGSDTYRQSEGGAGYGGAGGVGGCHETSGRPHGSGKGGNGGDGTVVIRYWAYEE